jgi:hypothetical protein
MSAPSAWWGADTPQRSEKKRKKDTTIKHQAQIRSCFVD